METNKQGVPTGCIDVPYCAICHEGLGFYGGPASLPCGHNGCLECLQKLQSQGPTPVCPLCRAPFEAEMALGQNVDLRDALERVASAQRVAERVADHQAQIFANAAGAQAQNQRSSEGRAADLTDPWIAVARPKNGQGGPAPAWTDWNGYEGHDQMGPQPPPVTLWNVLNGAVAILTGDTGAGGGSGGGGGGGGGQRRQRAGGGSRSSWEEAQGHRPSAPELPVSEGGNLEASWQRAIQPSMPMRLTGAGNDVRALEVLLRAEPPVWMPDSSATACMQCSASFRPLRNARHHCRLCGGIFCGQCSGGRRLMPVGFRMREPQRVCGTCQERLEPIQSLLAAHVSNAAQVATRDVTDSSSIRGWVNSPVGFSMEDEIFKATNTLRAYAQLGRLAPERAIPDAVLAGCAGLAIITVAKAGALLTYKLGTGLVVARGEEGGWSAPSAVWSAGVGWGAQFGGELTDFIIVLRTPEAVRAFCGRVHLSVGAGLSVAAGPLGRAAEADLRAGDGGRAACLTYSCSKGVFAGVSVESNLVATRSEANVRFYGSTDVKPRDLLLGGWPRPQAAAPLYSALEDLFDKVEAPQDFDDDN